MFKKLPAANRRGAATEDAELVVGLIGELGVGEEKLHDRVSRTIVLLETDCGPIGGGRKRGVQQDYGTTDAVVQ